MKKRSWFLLGSLLLLLGTSAVGYLLAPNLLREQIQQRLARRNLQAKIDGIHISPSGFHFDKIVIYPLGENTAIAELASTSVRMSWPLTPSGIEIKNAIVHFDQAQLETLKKLRENTTSDEATTLISQGHRIEIENLDVDGEIDDWKLQIKSGRASYRARKLQFDAELLTLQRDDIKVRLSDPGFALNRQISPAKLERLSSSNLELIAQFSSAEAGETANTQLPEAAPSSKDPQTQLTKAQPQAKEQPQARDQVKEVKESAAGPLQSLYKRFASKQETLNHLLDSVKASLPSLTEGRILYIPTASFEVAIDNASLKSQGKAFAISRNDQQISFELLKGVKDHSDQDIQGNLVLNISKKQIDTKVSGGPITLRKLGFPSGIFGIDTENSATVYGKFQTAIDLEAQTLDVKLEAKLQDITFEIAKLSTSPVSFPLLGIKGHALIDSKTRTIKIDESELVAGSAKLQLSGSVVSPQPDEDIVDLELRIPRSSCAEALQTFPPPLRPLLTDIKITGQLGLDATIQFSTKAKDALKLDWSLFNHCEFIAPPEALQLKNLHSEFEYTTLDSQGELIERHSGPSSDSWTPSSQIPPALTAAVLTCEDAAFYRHPGFDQFALKESLIQNLKAGTFVRGGSTITMQLAKNLYLAREKTLSRKLQELWLTIALEQFMSKSDILELYFNVIEFGPDVFGIREAAEYYFDKDPDELSVSEAMFLGCILPSPKKDRFNSQGELNKSSADYLKYTIKRAAERERITAIEEAEALEAMPVFWKRSATSRRIRHSASNTTSETESEQNQSQEF